ncbi:MAG: DNA mismatch repair endonuclease MutL [Acidobacteriota bacterium]|nr:MAG: DNA mismatch repair endonuclease MutL [Acidobacteriota bacterium]
MPRIQKLPEALVRQIAAGEVVERPASVVKELIENALDAGARRIDVRIEGGGARLVSVRDDGCGIGSEDAALAFERHATSKISSPEDLQKIRSLGFRGEALPSIASVARVRLLSTPRGESEGVEAVLEGGTAPAVRPAAARPGTEVEVRDLFFNTPARKKFLRTPQTEARRIAAAVSRLALAHPGVHVTLRSERKTMLDCPPVETLKERMVQVLGRDLAAGLVPLKAREGLLAVEGFATPPQSPLPNRDTLHFFVNRRPVQDRLLTGALLRAYPNLPARSYPGAVLFLEAPTEAVDVNVHPTKAEVRFRDSSAVFRLIELAVGEALGPRAVFSRKSPTHAPVQAPDRTASTASPVQRPASSSIRERAAPDSMTSRPQDPVELAAAPEKFLAEAPPRLVGGTEFPEPLAQYAGTYIVAQDDEGLLLFDQHAAHERVLYESLHASFEARRMERQALLFPLVLELSAEQAASLEDSALATLAALGFEAEAFGAATVRIRAVPSLLGEANADALVRDVVFALADDPALRSSSASEGGKEPNTDRLIATMACRAAVTKNMTLSMPKMREILAGLYQTKNPATCPHGRPTLLRYPLAEIERGFGRR